MFIEIHAKQLVEYCAVVTRIFNADDTKFVAMWTPVLEEINSRLPRGNGFNSGSEFLPGNSTESRLVFATSFHHMDECGGYDGWTEHNVIVTPRFGGFDIRVTGRNHNEIKDYIGDIFHDALSDYVKSAFDKESQEMAIVPAQYDYGFNGPIVRESHVKTLRAALATLAEAELYLMTESEFGAEGTPQECKALRDAIRAIVASESVEGLASVPWIMSKAEQGA